MSKIYYQERNHPNWTGRVPRQSRITGEWSRGRRVRARNDRIPPLGYLIGVLLLALLFFVSFI